MITMKMILAIKYKMFNALEALIKAGAFDCIDRNRAALVASIELAFQFAQSQEANANQVGLFDDAGGHGSSTQEPALVAH